MRHGYTRIPKQNVARRTVIGKHGYADTASHLQIMTAHSKWRDHRITDTRGDGGQTRRLTVTGVIATFRAFRGWEAG